MQVIKYVMTSKKFEGEVFFGYNELGRLTYYENASDMPDDHHVWLIKNLPGELARIEVLKSTIQGRIQEVPMEVTFEAFYDPFPRHRNKHRCIPLWKKLSEKHKIMAILSVEPYKNYLKRTGCFAQLPETYLQKQEYLNDWRSTT